MKKALKERITMTGKLMNYKELVPWGEQFLETGTAAGDGVQRALDAGFNTVYSCEAAEKWYTESLERFKGDNRVMIVNALSKDFLKMFVSSIKPQVIFLDAHPAGPLSAGHDDFVEKGDSSEFAQDNIIKTELGIILSKFNKHIIFIDDVNGLGDGHAEEYMEILLKANPGYTFYFVDENLSGDPAFYYKDKILIALPLAP